MPIIYLPDGSQRPFAAPVTVAQVAASIGAGLARAALAGKVDGQLVDMAYTIKADATVAIITDRDPEGLAIIRHSTAHLLANAFKILFPEAQVTIGPVIENGFYYDFAYKRPFTPEDLMAIEQQMHALSKQNLPVERYQLPRDKAIAYSNTLGEYYKAEIIGSIPADEAVSLYRQGEFVDLCRGPHVPSTGKLKIFKLMKVAGAYWRGDANNAMLQRIYGTAWRKQEDQDAYLRGLEEAEKRDHRKLSRQLDLFHLQDEAPGLVFWHPKGWALWQQVERYMRKMMQQYGYQEVRTPQVMDKTLWEQSGHWSNYAENMFITESEKRTYAVKPMNCPGHIQIYNQRLKSYRDLPIRLAEFGACHRNEPSGSLHGIMRVRGFTQDDAHIFCTADQLQAEAAAFIDMVLTVYRDFGFENVELKLSTRPEKRIGSDEDWDKSEKALAAALTTQKLSWELQPGEGAFYGPKIEFSLRDSLNRVWQCGTLQLDANLPERLGATYIADDNSKQVPLMLHRAVLGSMERFIGILIEHYAGAFPLWLAPVQIMVMNIAKAHADYATDIAKKLTTAGFRVETDLRNEKISYKIREHSLQKLPYQLIVGDKEKLAQVVAVRNRVGEDVGQLSITAFIERLKSEQPLAYI